MRQLNEKELDQVSGGFAPWMGAAIGGFVLGAGTAAISSYATGASLKSTLYSTALGGISGAAGGIATVTTGVFRAVTTINALGAGVGSGVAQGGVGEEEEIDIKQ